MLHIAQIEPRSWGQHPTSYIINPSESRKDTIRVDIIKPWTKLERKYNIYLIADDLCLSKLPFYIPKAQRVALLKESHLLPKVYDTGSAERLLKTFNLIITHYDSFIAADTRFNFAPFSSNLVGLNPYSYPLYIPATSQKSKFCSAILSLGSDAFVSPALFLRQQVIEYLRSQTTVELFGRSTNPIAAKADALIPYFFSIAMENTVSSSYFSEKLIDCILTGTIPIYHGSRSVLNYFDGRGILFFESLQELESILSSLTFESYRLLREYAVANFNAAINLMLADYHGYLHRVCDIVYSYTSLRLLKPIGLTNSIMAKIQAKTRLAIHKFLS